MPNVLLRVLVCFAAALAARQQVPIGIIVDSKSDGIVSILQQMVLAYNNNDASGDSIFFNASWIRADIDNMCDLIRAICKRLDSGVFLLLGSSSSRAYNTIQSYSQALHVPYLLFSETANQPGDGYRYDLSVSPSYVRPVADLVKFFNWDEMYYIFDADDALLELQSFHDMFREPPLDIVVDARRLRNLTSSHDFLRRLDKFSKPYKRIILNLSSPEAYQSILNQIVDVGMNRDNYHYILFGPYIDSLDLRSFLYGGVNVTGFRLRIDPERIKNFYPKAVSSTVDSLSITNVSIDAALAADGLHLVATTLNRMLASREEHEVFKTFRHRELYNWGNKGVQCWARPPLPWKHGPVIRRWLLQTTVQGMTGRVQLDNQGARSGYSLDVMQLEYRTPLRRVGSWTRDNGVATNMTRPKPQRVLLDANRTRHVTMIEENPFVMKKCPKADGSPCTGNDRFEGYCVDLLQKVAEIVGFDYDIHLVYDKKYGTKQADGSWNGMIGELLDGDADLAIAALTITEVRERFVDFSKPFMDLGTSIMIKKPDKEKGGVFSFKNPLSDGVWIAIIMGFIGVSLVLFFVGRFSPYEWDTGAPEAFVRGEPMSPPPVSFDGGSGRRNGSFREDVDTFQVSRRGNSSFREDVDTVQTSGRQQDSDYAMARPAFSLANTVWFSLGALMQQGSDIYPRSISGRIVGSAWWFFTLIIISSYTANLAAFLTIERMEIPIDSADDLVRQTEIRYGIIANGSTEEFFKVSNVTVYSKMWTAMANAEPSVFVNTTLAGVERVRNEKGKYAFLLDSSFNDYHNQRKPCNTMKVGRNLDNKGYGIATPRGSDLRADINIAVLNLNEIGELLKLYQKWWYDKGQCASDSGKESKTSALTLSNVSGIFHILIGGLILAMIVALFDFLIKHRIRKKKKILAKNYPSTMYTRGRPMGRLRRMSDENGECRYATLDPIISREIENHRCRHRDEAL